MAVLIRRACASDLAAALDVMSEAFGVPVRAPSVHTLVFEAPDGHLLLAEDGGRVVGTAAAAGFGRTGWLGGVAVAPSARGAGLGRALTEAALDVLGPRETVLLLASDAGRPIYERLGFVADGEYRVFGVSDGVARVPVRTRAASREEALTLDARVTGEDRALALAASTAVTLDGDAIALRPPWPALPILARSPDAGEALLRGLAEPGLRLAAPAANERAVEVMSELGAEREGVLRMRRGPAVAWRPAELWGVFSLFFG